MLNNIATKISSIIIQKCRLSSDLIKIYTYGCELLISTGLGMMSVFLISCLLGRPLSGIIFLIVFVSLRLYCGGLHASTYLRCFIRNKRISRVLAFTEMIVILAIYTIIRNIYFLSIASTSMFAVSFMMLIPKICQARRVRYE